MKFNKPLMNIAVATFTLTALDAMAQTAPAIASGGNMGSSVASMAKLVLFVIFVGLSYRFIKVQLLKRKSYDWYKSQFPALVTGGRVKCHKCDGFNIGTERMMNKTFMRAHVCRQCGTTLYYSKES